MTAGEATRAVPRGAGISYWVFHVRLGSSQHPGIFFQREIAVTYADSDGTALAALLDGERVRSTKVGTPVTTTDGDDAKLGNNDGGADSSGNLLGGLDTQTNVALGVTNDDDGLETGTLTGTGLLLDGLDL